VDVVPIEYLGGAFRAHVLRTIVVLTGIAALGLCVLSDTAQAAPRYAGMAVDANTGKVLYAKNADKPRYPASLTKIMTLYLLFDFIAEGKVDYTTDFYVTKHAAAQAPSKLGLKPGQTIRAIDAIRALVTKSANDVAAVVAENLGGSEVNFAKMMTKKARSIGMRSTTFRNASGLPNKQQVTTARDMVTMSLAIQRDHPKHYRFFRTKQFKYRGRRYRNHNALLFSYKGTDGIKTGYTRASGFNLTSSVRRGNKHVVAAVMGGKSSKSRNAQMRRVLDRSLRKASKHKRPPANATPPKRKSAPAPLVSQRGSAPLALASRAQHETHIDPEELAQIEDALAHERRMQRDVSRTAAIAPGRTNGDFHVQVGAYKTSSDASQQLSMVKSVAGDLLAGHSALTMPYRKKRRALYRARFAGFSEATARSACSRLKQRSIACVVMRAE